jgi:hypothetical protein
LREEEKRLITDIKKIQKNHADAKEIASKNMDENMKDIAKLKKLLNEAQTDSELNLKYMQ